MADDALWQRNGSSLFMLVRLFGLAIFFLGLADRLHRLAARQAAGRGRRDRRDHGRDRRGLRAAAAQEALGASRTGEAPVKRFWKDVERSSEMRRLGRPARRRAGADAGPSRADRADRSAGRSDRRRMAIGRGQDRPARDAADRPRQCRDRPGRARQSTRSPPASRATREADLACYRAEGPRGAGRRCRPSSWDALLGWARRRFDVDFVHDQGDRHVAQPPATVEQPGACGRGARCLPARRPVAAGDDRRLAARGAGVLEEAHAARAGLGRGQRRRALAARAMGRRMRRREAALENRRARLPRRGALPGAARS